MKITHLLSLLPLILCQGNAYCQSRFDHQIDSLSNQRKIKLNQIQMLEAEIRGLDAAILNVRRQSVLSSADTLVDIHCGGSVGCAILSEPSTSGNILRKVSVNELMQINLHPVGGEYVKVVYKEVVGYVYYGVLERTPALIQLFEPTPSHNSPPQKTPIPSAAKQPYTSGTSSYPSSSNYRSTQTGPRGGKYYINSNGKKTFVKKK